MQFKYVIRKKIPKNPVDSDSYNFKNIEISENEET